MRKRKQSDLDILDTEERVMSFRHEQTILNDSRRNPDIYNEWAFHVPNEYKELINAGDPTLPLHFTAGLPDDIADMYFKNKASYRVSRNTPGMSAYTADTKMLMKCYGKKPSTKLSNGKTKYLDNYDNGYTKANELNKESLGVYLNSINKQELNDILSLEKNYNKLNKALRAKQKYWVCEETPLETISNGERPNKDFIMFCEDRRSNAIFKYLKLIIFCIFGLSVYDLATNKLGYLTFVKTLTQLIDNLTLRRVATIGAGIVILLILMLIYRIIVTFFDIHASSKIQKMFRIENEILEKRNIVKEKYLTAKKVFCEKYPMFLLTEPIEETMKHYKSYIKDKKNTCSVTEMYKRYVDDTNTLNFDTHKLNIM